VRIIGKVGRGRFASRAKNRDDEARESLDCSSQRSSAYRLSVETAMVTCHDLAARIELMQPTAPPREVARLCLLLTNAMRHELEFGDEEQLARAWQEMSLRLQAATDQHAAMTDELERLAGLTPQQFGAEQVCVLIRAIKVQSQVLQLYVGQAAATPE
jgi:hypothetical protein